MDAYTPKFLKQYTVFDVVKTPFNITFYCPDRLVWWLTTGVDNIYNIPDCVFLRPIGTEAIAMRIKSGLAYRFQYDSHALLDNMVVSLTIASNSPVNEIPWPDFSYSRSWNSFNPVSVENLTFKCTRLSPRGSSPIFQGVVLFFSCEICKSTWLVPFAVGHFSPV